MVKEYSRLQNGSDIRGIAMNGIEGEEQNLTTIHASNIGAGFLRWLSEKTGKEAKDLKIAIGRDSRLSGETLKDAFVSGIHAPITVLDCGIATTPAMFMATVFPNVQCDGAVMITASHLPWNRNGFKFFDKDGGLQKENIKDILAFAAETAEKGQQGDSATCEAFDLMSEYSAHLRGLIAEKTGCAEADKPLASLKIAVDAGNGSGGFYATDVLAPLGADVSASKYLDPDGHFPNHIPNPENNEALRDLSAQVVNENCDFGIIFDTDVDRSSAVDGKGNAINHDSIVALAASLVADEHPGGIVVTDSITSNHLTYFLCEELGMEHFRYRRGYKNVINKALELTEAGIDCPLAIETSGHAAMKENYFLDDGAYLATRIVIKAAQMAKEGKTLDSLIAGLRLPLENREVRMHIHYEDWSAFGDALLEEFKNWATEKGLQVVDPNYEGVRINFEHGWCLLRKSLHEPLMPLNIQSDIEGGVEKISMLLREFLGQYDDLDSSNL